MSEPSYAAGRRFRRIFWVAHNKETGFLIRLGRMFHWLMLILAVVAFGFGVMMQFDHNASVRHYEAYRAQHPEAYGGAGYPLYNSGAPWPQYSDTSAFWFGLAAAIAAGLFGRAVRYVLSDE